MPPQKIALDMANKTKAASMPVQNFMMSGFFIDVVPGFQAVVVM